MINQPFYEPTRDLVHNLDVHYRSINNVPYHFHQAVEIICVLSGETDFQVGQTQRRISRGDIVFVPPLFAHRSLSAGDCTAVVLILPKRYHLNYEQAADGKGFTFLCDKQKNSDVIQRIEELATRQTLGEVPEFLSHAYSDMVLGLILDRYEPTVLDNGSNDLVISVINYIDEHYKDDITLEKISSHFGYSKYHFSRLFNATFKCSLPSYVNAVRARAVTKSDTQSKTKAIIDSGFNTLSTFYRARK